MDKMANSYSQIYLHFIFSVKNREPVLKKEWRIDLFKYISGIIIHKNQKPLIINGVEDHIHLLVSIKPDLNIASFIRDIKSSSSKYINEKKLVQGKFFWQGGYAVFSHSNSQIGAIYKYILNQEIHHKKKSFKEEYREFLDFHKVNYKQEYLF